MNKQTYSEKESKKMPNPSLANSDPLSLPVLRLCNSKLWIALALKKGWFFLGKRSCGLSWSDKKALWKLHQSSTLMVENITELPYMKIARARMSTDGSEETSFMNKRTHVERLVGPYYKEGTVRKPQRTNSGSFATILRSYGPTKWLLHICNIGREWVKMKIRLKLILRSDYN